MSDFLPYIMCVVAVAASYLATKWVCRNAVSLGLVQEPNHRSSHVIPTPVGGGLGIAAGAMASMLPLGYQDPQILGMLGLGLLLAAVGLHDDRESVPMETRLFAQFIVCAVVLWFISPPSIAYWMPLAAWLVLAVLAGMWWINLFNFMDGIDGIAGTQAITMLAAACAIAYAIDTNMMYYTVWWCMLLLALATAGFLLHNWPPAKIFMGDVGSTFLAFAIFALALMTVAHGWLNYAVWLILGAVFVVDSSLTLLRRMLVGERWFEAHRSHAYQHLARRWNSHKRVTVLVGLINILWLAPLAYFAMRDGSNVCLYLVVAYAPLVALVLWCGAGKKSR